jgi:integrase
MPYKRTQNNKTTWIGEVRKNGITKRKSFATKREASEWERDCKKELDGAPKPAPQTLTDSLLEWGTWYLNHAERFTKKVFSEKKTELKRFLAFLKSRGIAPEAPITAITPEIALAYCQGQYKKRGAKAVNAKVLKNLVAAYSHGIKFKQYPTPNPFMLVEKYPEDETHGHYVPSEKDFLKVLAQAGGQDRLLLLTFLHTAGRRSEIYRLKWEDVDFESGTVALRTRKTKTGSLRVDHIPLTPELATMLKEHKAKSGYEHIFTQSVGRHKGKPYTENRGFPQTLCEQAGVKAFGCHGIRGLTATMLAKNGVPLKTIQEILRHQKLNTTERYLRNSNGAREALISLSGCFSTLEKFSPLSIPPETEKRSYACA